MAAPAPQPCVSILIRSLDRPQLHEALASVAAQTWPRLEVVVVAVHPGHSALPATVGPHPLRLLPAEVPRARSLAANTALDAATGDWLLFLDDDDWLMPDHVQRLVRALQPHPHTRAAYAGVALVDAWGQPLGQAFDLPFDATRLLAGNLTPIHAVLFSRDLLAKGCRFDEALDRYEDWDFWLQVARHTVMLHVPGVSAVYRIHDSSGVHNQQDAGVHHAGRLHEKWLSVASPGQRDDLMRRAWAYDDAQARLAAAAGLAEARHREQLQAVSNLQTSLEQQLQRSREEQAQQAREAANCQIELDQAHTQLQLLTRLLDEQLVVAARLQVDVQALHDSTSWRLTAPLRGVMQLARGRLALRPVAMETPLGRLWAAWQRDGAWQTVQRVGRRLARAVPGDASASAKPIEPMHGGRLGNPAMTGHPGPLGFYAVVSHGQRRQTLVLQRLACAADQKAAQAGLQRLVALANQNHARLRIITIQGKPDGRLLDAWLLQQALHVHADTVLNSAEGVGIEFDLLPDETVAVAGADLCVDINVLLAAVPTAQRLNLTEPSPLAANDAT